MEETPQKKKATVRTAIGVVIGASIVTAVQTINKSTPYKELIKITEESNKKGAFMVDAETRLDSTWAIEEPLGVGYAYTVVSADKDSVTDYLDDIKKELKKSTQENLDKNPDMKTFRDYNVSMNFNYKDKKGRDFMSFTIQPTKTSK